VFACCAPDLKISDDYNGGATFMLFLAAQFGEGIHLRLLQDTSATFAGALTAVTRPYTRSQLFTRLQTWLRAPPLPESPPNKRLKLPGGDRFNGNGVFVPWRARTIVPHPCASERVARSLSAIR